MVDYPQYTPPDESRGAERLRFTGLDGWLVLLGISLALAILPKSYGLFQMVTLVTGPDWEMLTRAPYPTYDPLWRPFILFDLCASAHLWVLNAVVIYLFWKQRRSFIPMFIVYILANLTATVVDVVFISSISNASRDTFNLTIIQLFLLSIYSLITCPYVKTSTQVEIYFTR